MNLELLSRFLIWSLAINYGVLLVWFLAFAYGRRALFTLHSRWFTLSDSTFDAIHYGAMAFYKIGILLFNLVPLIALYLVRDASQAL
jgi:hypothetical protein